MGRRIWHQSFTVLAKLEPYRAALEAHVSKVCRPDTEVVLHGMHPDTYQTEYPGIDIRYAACYRPIVMTGGELTLEMPDLRYSDEAPGLNAGQLFIDSVERLYPHTCGVMYSAYPKPDGFPEEKFLC